MSLAKESSFSVADPISALFWLGCVFPGGVVLVWNIWMQFISDALRKRHYCARIVDHVAHRIVDIEYLGGFTQKIPNLGWSTASVSGKCLFFPVVTPMLKSLARP
jgi:hypothetical protein